MYRHVTRRCICCCFRVLLYQKPLDRHLLLSDWLECSSNNVTPNSRLTWLNMIYYIGWLTEKQPSRNTLVKGSSQSDGSVKLVTAGWSRASLEKRIKRDLLIVKHAHAATSIERDINSSDVSLILCICNFGWKADLRPSPTGRSIVWCLHPTYRKILSHVTKVSTANSS